LHKKEYIINCHTFILFLILLLHNKQQKLAEGGWNKLRFSKQTIKNSFFFHHELTFPCFFYFHHFFKTNEHERRQAEVKRARGEEQSRNAC